MMHPRNAFVGDFLEAILFVFVLMVGCPLQKDSNHP